LSALVWAPAYLAPGILLGEMGEDGDWRYLIFPVAAVGLIVVVWGLLQTRRRR
jgi:membrane protein DedA with SNARE-associated domain